MPSMAKVKGKKTVSQISLSRSLSSFIIGAYNHGGESGDFRGLKMADTYQNPSTQVRLSFRLSWDLKQITWKNESNMSILSNFQTNIWLKSY